MTHDALRLLFVSPRFPLPATRGDELIVWHRLRTLAPRHELTLVCGYERPPEPTALERVEALCGSVRLVHVPRLASYVRMAALGAVSREPFGVLRYRSRDFLRAVRDTLAADRFDVVHAFTLGAAPHAVGAPCARVLEPIDSLQPMLESVLPALPRRSRWLYERQLRRVAAYEPAVATEFERLIVVSDADRAKFGAADVAVIPNGVDTIEFSPSGPGSGAELVVFSGNMSYAPNAQAVEWFVEHCWPRVRSAVPEAVFRVVGTSPGREVQALGGRDGVEVAGRVPSVAEELRRAAVAVAPMRSGSGIQNKILEAMACALPVVTTRTGLGPIEARPSEEILVADSAEELAADVAELLRTPERRSELGRSAREFVVRRHSWERAADQVEAVYRQAIDQRGVS